MGLVIAMEITVITRESKKWTIQLVISFALKNKFTMIN